MASIENSFGGKSTFVGSRDKAFVENKMRVSNAPVYNFDVTATYWDSVGGVTDKASFIDFLETTSFLTDVIVENFSLIGGRLQCNLTANGYFLYLIELAITDVYKLGDIDGLGELVLSGNQIVTFNPTIALPSSLQVLYLNSNQIVTFNPTIALPSSLLTLDLNGNQIVTFNPTIALPSSLLTLDLNFNQMTTAGYIASETWATTLHIAPAGGKIYFITNIDSVSGTTLETILTGKGWTVIS